MYRASIRRLSPPCSAIFPVLIIVVIVMKKMTGPAETVRMLYQAP